jgi:hypothetical protein
VLQKSGRGKEGLEVTAHDVKHVFDSKVLNAICVNLNPLNLCCLASV